MALFDLIFDVMEAGRPPRVIAESMEGPAGKMALEARTTFISQTPLSPERRMAGPPLEMASTPQISGEQRSWGVQGSELKRLQDGEEGGGGVAANACSDTCTCCAVSAGAQA